MSENDHERFVQWDAAYVLGALSPADRHTYEAHLEQCRPCRDAVGGLASMPGLLARIQPEPEATVQDRHLARGEAPVPADWVDRMLHKDEQRRSRRRQLLGWTAAVAAVLVLAITVPLSLMDQTPEDVVSVVLHPTAALSTDMTVEVELGPTAWGTRLSVECGYPTGYLDEQTWYALVVTDTDGTSSQVSTWQAVAGETVTLDAATAVDLDDIASLAVLSEAGEVVLTASVPRG